MYRICLFLVLLFAACNSPEIPSVGDRGESDKYSNYIITCKHPLGHIMKHVVSASSWRNSYGSRSGVFRFRDINGIYHENSVGCYTNDLLRVDKEGNFKK
tara:strand:+ start:877 stop:1176 length:300 start_codon:yes stop_codon:yes gene_type:complete